MGGSAIGLLLLLAVPTGALHLPSVAAAGQVALPRPAADGRTSPPTAALPAVGTLAAACTAPTLLGFWKTEYGVSYAYGAAMAACGALTLPAAATCGTLARAHALVLVLYGVRLNSFLLFREATIPRFRKFREKIEERTKQSGSRLKRAPFVLGCSLLYYCMGAPLMVTAAAPAAGVARTALAIEVGLMYAGFAVAAIGDLQKTLVKAKEGEDALVRTGLFRWLRHPNYTGELLLWGTSAAAALTLAPTAVAAGVPMRAVGGWLIAAVTGYAGIAFVLVGAATGLEKRQREKYGAAVGAESGAYEDWVARSWAGPTK